ncbi:MAG: biotin/lipoyl-containing protein, partial [Thermodesulfobacteriota bacterium]
NVMDRVMSLPRTKEFINWKPEGYDKSIEEIREELGGEISDDELLLRVLIPGKPLKRAEPKKVGASPSVKAQTPICPDKGFPTEFRVDVDGEIFHVKISPVRDGGGKAEALHVAESLQVTKTVVKQREVPSGAIFCGMAGLVLSIEAKVGARVNAGDLVAIIEAMKMRRPINSPRSGVVKEVLVREGEMVSPEDILMVVE